MMNSFEFSISSPAATAIFSVRVKNGKSASQFAGLYCAGINDLTLCQKDSMSGFLAESLHAFGGMCGYILFSDIEGVLLDVEKYPLIRRTGFGAVFKFTEPLSGTDLGTMLAQLPHGAISILEASGDIEEELMRVDKMALDGLLATLHTRIKWAIEYDESGIVTLLSRDKNLIWQQVVCAMQRYV